MSKSKSGMVTSQSLATKYRPRKLEDIVGQDNAVRQIKGMLKSKKIPNSILMVGPSGCGKTTLARILAHEVNGTDPSFPSQAILEKNVADERGIDIIRQIAKSMEYRTSGNGLRFAILDECHTLLQASASALLKVLEETPPHAAFILCTNEPERLLETIRNRCEKIVLKSYDTDDLVPMLKNVTKKENIVLGKNKEEHVKVLRKIIELSGNVPRESLQILSSLNHIILAEDIDVKKMKSKNVEKLINQAIESVMDVDAEKVATKILLALYLNKPASVIQAVSETSNYNGLIAKLLDLNRYILDMKTKSKTYHSYGRRRFIEFLNKKYSKDPDLDSILKVHSLLVNMKIEMGSYLVGEPHLLVSRLGTFKS